jgi:hypothetical protein
MGDQDAHEPTTAWRKRSEENQPLSARVYGGSGAGKASDPGPRLVKKKNPRRRNQSGPRLADMPVPGHRGSRCRPGGVLLHRDRSAASQGLPKPAAGKYTHRGRPPSPTGLGDGASGAEAHDGAAGMRALRRVMSAQTARKRADLEPGRRTRPSPRAGTATFDDMTAGSRESNWMTRARHLPPTGCARHTPLDPSRYAPRLSCRDAANVRDAGAQTIMRRCRSSQSVRRQRFAFLLLELTAERRPRVPRSLPLERLERIRGSLTDCGSCLSLRRRLDSSAARTKSRGRRGATQKQ